MGRLPPIALLRNSNSILPVMLHYNQHKQEFRPPTLCWLLRIAWTACT